MVQRNQRIAIYALSVKKHVKGIHLWFEFMLGVSMKISQNYCGTLGFMEGSENILETIYEEENLEDFQDVEMLDSETLEEGECREQIGCLKLTEIGDQVAKIENQEPLSKSRRRRAKRKKKKIGSGSNVTDINRFVLDTCRRLKERKPYLVWNAVGCLGVSALNDLVREVDAIQACGGQMTADGKRCRTGGGILWSILKAREPKAYKEIMTKGKEFERQFRPQNMRQVQEKSKEPPSSQRTARSSFVPMIDQVSNGSELTPPVNNELQNSNTNNGERVSVLNRIRVPVTYDDLIGEDVKDE
ncbi:Phosphorylated adapter RNA export protein [Macleaya cordata]|uniref:Phosphorylated adapter RNA export protein n=1 Tax=Macleaya cordata TaxID=56857 RepID=A0A200QMN1_MACCD|nr:Phosphorylated adapter RNA export protein [Macleaya cordata]